MLKYFQKYLFQINCGAKYVFFYFQNKFFSFLNLDFYKNFYQKENLATKIGTTYDELIDNTSNLLDYLNYKAELNTSWYTPKDILHMVDVRTLYSISHKIMIVFLTIFIISTILLVVLCKRNTIYYISKTFNKVLLSFFVVIGGLACIISYNFNSFWIKFHQLLFSNDLWLLSPDESNLIQMVPEEFFISLITKIIIHIFILFISLFIINFVIKKKANYISI